MLHDTFHSGHSVSGNVNVALAMIQIDLCGVLQRRCNGCAKLFKDPKDEVNSRCDCLLICIRCCALHSIYG